jgi:CRP-like cAMP-binding protein
MQEAYVEEGEDIITEGEEGDKFFVLEEGEAEIIINGAVVAPMKEGCFGDLALMYNSPRSATIRALSECHMWTLDRVFFRNAMVNSSSKQHEAVTKFLGQLQLFQDVSMENRAKMACSFTKMIYSDGDYIIRQGEIGEMFYVLFSGQVNCTKTLEDGSEIDLIQLDAGQIFGERALIKQEPRGANVIAMGETECLTMSKVDFKIMLQDVVDQMNQINEFRIMRAAPMFRLLTDNQVVLHSSQPQHTSVACRITLRMTYDITPHTCPPLPSPNHITRTPAPAHHT